MPILNRGQRPAQRPARATRAWPAVIVLTAAIVFLVFVVQATLALALLMAMATLVAGAVLLTLVSGTTWITELRRALTDLRRRDRRSP